MTFILTFFFPLYYIFCKIKVTRDQKQYPQYSTISNQNIQLVNVTILTPENEVWLPRANWTKYREQLGQRVEEIFRTQNMQWPGIVLMGTLETICRQMLRL